MTRCKVVDTVSIRRNPYVRASENMGTVCEFQVTSQRRQQLEEVKFRQDSELGRKARARKQQRQ